MRYGIKFSRKSDTVATVRFMLNPPSKKAGRKGTRRSWKRRHPPRTVDMYIGDASLESIQSGSIPQMLLSQKHMRFV
jgi:hypothetical protein